jgi:Uma2 family endonuclease
MPAATKLTYADYAALPDDGKRYELIDGELLVNPSPVPIHQTIALNIASAFREYFRKHGGGGVFVAPLDIVVSDAIVLEPDIIVIKHDRAGIVGPKNIVGPPHLLVEVLSGSTRRRDEVVKRGIYEQFGVDEYWIVDPDNELVRGYRRKGAAYLPVFDVNTVTGGIITTPLLAEFALPVEDVFSSWGASDVRT